MKCKTNMANVKLIPVPKLLASALLAPTLLLATSLATVAHGANLKVTTTADENNNNGACSLREAVALVNTELKDTKSDCYPEDKKPTSIVELKAETTYQLNNEINIRKPLAIQSDLVRDITNLDGKKISVIHAKKGRAFVIDDGSSLQHAQSVTLKGLEIRGEFYGKDSIAAADVSVSEGGLIYNREQLFLEKVRLLGGGANKGGAIYNASLDAKMTVKETEIIGNFAEQGAGVYSEYVQYTVSQSLFHKNKAITAGSGFALETLKGYEISPIPKPANQEVAKKPYVIKPVAKISNSIFFDNSNTGALNLVSGVQVNNITVVNNAKGVQLNSYFPHTFEGGTANARQVIAAQLANSVLLNNNNYDVSVAANDLTFANHLVLDAGKLSGAFKANYAASITQLSAAQTKDLLAAQTITVEGKEEVVCRAPQVGETTGLFCPLIKQEDEFVANIKPRLLMSYTKLADSPIVNKGATRQNITNANSLQCEANDIRGEARSICDIGAFELNINKEKSGSIKEVNDEIPYGSTASLSLKDLSADGQLLPASECSKYISNPPADAKQWLSGKVGEWTDGCITFIAGKQPTRGKLSLNDAKDRLLFKPNYNFHGVETFEYQLVTTTSRFSDATNDQKIRARSKVYQHPEGNFQSDTINGFGFYGETGSGSMDLGILWFLLGLGGFGTVYKSRWYRAAARRKQD